MRERAVPTADGYWVAEKFHHLAEILQDYDSNFELVWIPPDKRVNPEDDANAFAIVDKHQDFKPYIVMQISIHDDPSKVLAKLFEYDNRRHSKEQILNKIDLENKAAELMKLKAQEEEIEEQKDLIRFFARTRKHTIQMGKGVKLDSELRRLE